VEGKKIKVGTADVKVPDAFDMKVAFATFSKQCVTLRGHARFHAKEAGLDSLLIRKSDPIESKDELTAKLLRD